MTFKELTKSIFINDSMIGSIGSVSLAGVMLDQMSKFCGGGDIKAIFFKELQLLQKSIDIGFDLVVDPAKIILAYIGLRLILELGKTGIKELIEFDSPAMSGSNEMAITKHKTR
jgi:hypothetical protein